MSASTDHSRDLSAAVARTSLPKAAVLVFARVDPTALGVALGTASGLWILVATLVLVAKGGPSVGYTLRLLSNYFLGYAVTVPGAFIGFGYAFLVGFVAGFVTASLRNFLMHAYLVFLRRRAERAVANDILDKLM